VSHFLPKEMVDQYLLYLFGTKMPHKTTGVSFLQKHNAKRNQSWKWNFSQPFPWEHLEYGAAKYESWAYTSLILSNPRTLISSSASKTCRRDKASATTLYLPFLYLTILGKDSINSL
jgi:hypothetical protein